MPRTDALQVIDLEVFRSGGPSLPNEAEALDTACRARGFFAVVGHDIERPLQDFLLDRARAFFALPIEEKRRLSDDASPGHTGWVALDAEPAPGALAAGEERKEALSLVLEPEALQPAGRRATEPLNRMPDVEHLDAAVIAYQRAALDAASIVLRGLALALSLRAGYFERMMRTPHGQLRLLHYPRAVETGDPGAGEALGCGPHRDSGLITLLLADTPGLELLDADGTWTPVDGPEGGLIVNIGDLFARWTNGRYVSTVHRVANPVGADRYAAAMFIDPDPSTIVAPLPTDSVAADGGLDDITVGDYLRERLQEPTRYRWHAQAG